MTKQHALVWFALTLIILGALFARSYHISSIPSGLYPDEAVNAVDALSAINSGNYQLFYPNNYGREGLFINLQALSLKTFGYTVGALKLWSIIFGTLTVLGTYFLGRELFHRRGAALLGAFFIATSYWAINFSRIGFRAIMTSFLISFAFFFFFKGLRTRRYLDFALAGLCVGLGLHTYIAFRLTPLILIALLPFLMLSYENFLKRYWKQGLVFALTAFIAASPMLYHFFIAHPEDFASRSTAISVFAPEVNHGDLPGTLFKTFGLSLLKYNFWGDQNWRHNYPPYPILDPITGFFFLGALLFLISQTVALLGRRLRHRDRDTRLVRNIFLLSAFFIMLMPEFFTAEGLPHALRAIGTQVPVFLMAGLGAFWIYRRIMRAPSQSRVILLSLFFITLGLSATFNLTKYFIFFANSPDQRGAFNEDYTNMATYLLSLPPETKKYVYTNAGGTDIDNGLPVTAESLYFLTYGKIENLIFLKPDTSISTPAVVILMRYDDAIAKRLLNRHPGSAVETIYTNPHSPVGFPAIILP
ncbi:MAG: glycosyltransferase family 39 protein [Patescibacteria group bacterium]